MVELATVALEVTEYVPIPPVPVMRPTMVNPGMPEKLWPIAKGAGNVPIAVTVRTELAKLPVIVPRETPLNPFAANPALISTAAFENEVAADKLTVGALTACEFIEKSMSQIGRASCRERV